MKMNCLFTITILLILSCAGILKTDSIKDFIPGTYISSWKTEFNESIDTLLIELLVEHGSETYSITRRTHVTYFNDDLKREPAYKIIHWTGNYDPGPKTIFINNNGRMLSFDPVNKLLKMGTTTYRKL